MPPASTSTPSSPAAGRLPAILGPVAVVAAALLAYGGSLQGDYVFDDLSVFTQGSAMANGEWWNVAFGNDHTPLANRPFTCFLFAINPSFGANYPVAFKAGNLLLHVLNALLLLGVVRRCLLAPNLAGRFSARSAAGIATAVSALWACHPLGTDAVVYITQRSTLLMSGGLLAALYCLLRGAESPRPRRWLAVGVVAMALGMASKEDLVGGPLLVPLFERAFLLPDWRSLRHRVRTYAAFASTWIVLGLCVALGPSNVTVGWRSLVPVGPFEWLMTQADVILYYTRLVVWPHPLRGAYDFGIVRSLGDAAVPLALVAALFVAAAWQWRRRPWLGFLWTMFFVLLGPTSSVMPIVTEVAAERRMYLPMLAVLVPLVLLAARGCQRLAGRARLAPNLAVAAPIVLGLAAASTLGLATRQHAPVYTNQPTFWRDAYLKNDLANDSLVSSIILCAYSRFLFERGQRDEAIALVERAMRCPGHMDTVPMTYAKYLRDEKRFAEAERVLREFLNKQSTIGAAFDHLAFVLIAQHEADLVQGRATASDPRLVEAVECAKRAYELDARAGPEVAASYLNTLGMAYTRQGRLAEAESVLRSALHKDPKLTEAKKSLGAVLCFMNRFDEGIALWRQVLATNPEDIDLRVNLGQALARAGDAGGAARMFQEVLQRQPDHAGAQQALRALPAAGR